MRTFTHHSLRARWARITLVVACVIVLVTLYRMGITWFALPNTVPATLQPWRDASAAPAPAPAPRPAPRAQAASHAGINAFNLVSWNLEWLADADALVSAKYWDECTRLNFPNAKPFDRQDLPFCDVYAKRGITTDAHYRSAKLAPLRARLAELAVEGMDVLSTQEVQRPSALAQVLPAGFEVLCATTRPDPQNLVIAVRRGWARGLRCEEVRALSGEDTPGVVRPVRRGLALSVPARGQTLQLLNVHLKASCPKGPLDSIHNTACATLRHQAAPLEAWIEAQATAGHPFIIAGDWNRDLEAEARRHYPARSDGSDPQGPINPDAVRNLWPELNDMAPPNSAMALVKMDRNAAHGRACHGILDQMVVSVTLRGMLRPSSLDAGELPATFLGRPAAASDHCPMRTRLVF